MNAEQRQTAANLWTCKPTVTDRRSMKVFYWRFWAAGLRKEKQVSAFCFAPYANFR